MQPFFVYLLKCADGSYYAGHTDELERHIDQHQAGELPGYTHDKRPVTLVWSQPVATREEALAAEMRIKGWSRAKKEALIREDWDQVRELARSRSSQGDRSFTSSVRTEAGASTSSARTEERASFNRLRTIGNTGSARTEDGGCAPPQPVRAELVEAPAPAPLPTDPLLTPLLAPPGPAQRRAIAKTITLLESTRADHRLRADALLSHLLPHTGKSFRLGLSGVPGVGKSTFIEALGLYLIGQGHRVAVLAVDPSSSVSGGSILGDKTRMEHLSVHVRAFIRPSPAAGNLGGVAEKTRESMLVCEAAGYDIVIVETVGVGQSETAVSAMTDMFVLLQLPNAGDDLQAIKKGVMELADLVIINKADLDEAAATRARAQITSALRLFGPHGRVGAAQALHPTQVLQLSALKGSGLQDFWQAVTQFRQAQVSSGEQQARRHAQDQAWMWERIEAGLRQRFAQHPAVAAALPDITRQVHSGTLAASAAARRLLDLLN